MKYHFFLSLIVAALSLSACETAQKKPMPSGYVVRQTQDFMTTGRGLSDGAVDLYQPGTDFLPTAEYPTTGKRVNVSPVSGSTTIMSRDPNVTIYNLDTMNVSEPQEPPMPPDVGIPAIQPPINLQENYPSPFDENGNPIP